MRTKTWKRYDNKKKPLTEEEIKDIVEKKYCDCLPNTKQYIANGLRTVGPKFKARICIMVKQDFIDEFYKTKLGKYKFNFDNVPEVIMNVMEEFIITCEETICGIQVGKLKISRHSTINYFYDPMKNLHDFIGIELDEDKMLRENSLNEINKKGLNKIFDFSESKFIRPDIPIKFSCLTCKTDYWDTIENILTSELYCDNCREQERLQKQIEIEGIVWLREAKMAHQGNCDYDNAVYKGSKEPVIGLVCGMCGEEFEQLPDAHLRSIYGYCPACCKKLAGAKSRSNLDIVKEGTERRYGVGVFDWSKAKYETNQTPIILTEISSGIEFEITPNHLLNGTGLPITHRTSMGERNVQTWISKHLDELDWKPQQTHKEVEGREGDTYVKIDFEFFKVLGEEKHIWLECNGKQHYEYISYFCGYEPNSEESIEQFRKQLRRDQNVKDYCKENGIMFIELPYTCYDLDKIDDILTRILFNGENPEDVITLPPIQQI